jgi:thioredoxin reductase
MSAIEKARLLSKGLGFFLPYLGRVVYQETAALLHRWTWRETHNAKNVVVIGGSFAGIELVRRLAQTLPTGYKAVWIEKNSHLNYSFNFPRFSVMTGQEHTAFIPYDGIARSAPLGILTRIQDKAVQVSESQVILASGQKINYSYLIVATGSSQPLPVNVLSTDRAAACHELQEVQQAIISSRKIAIVGGGAVGVELASDIKDFYPDKEVTLIHSRNSLLNNFGTRLQEYALTALRDELSVRVLLNERPPMPAGSNMARSATLKFSDKREEHFDLIVSSILKSCGNKCLTSCSLDWMHWTATKLSHLEGPVARCHLRKDLPDHRQTDPSGLPTRATKRSSSSYLCARRCGRSWRSTYGSCRMVASRCGTR